MILTREILHPELKFSNMSRTQLCDMIDFWKIVLWEKYSMRPGDRIAIIFTVPDPYYLSLLFASFELGLTVVLTSNAAKIKNPQGLRQALYSNLKLALYDDMNAEGAETNRLFFQTVDHANIFDTYKIKDPTLYDTVAKQYFALPNDVAILTTTSGSTGVPQLVPKTHEFYFVSSQRQVRLLNYTADDKVLHTRQISHGGAFDIFWLPTLMACQTHIVHSYGADVEGEFLDADIEELHLLIDLIIDQKITRFWAIDTNIIDNLLTHFPRLDHDFNMFHINNMRPHWPTLVKEKNLKSFTNSYGTIEIGSSVLLNIIDRNTDLSTYRINAFRMLDDWYQFECLPASCIITNNYTKESMEFKDCWQQDGDEYLFLGRSNSYKINGVVFTEPQVVDIVKQYITQPFDVVVDVDYQKLYLAVYEPFNPEIVNSINAGLQVTLGQDLRVNNAEQLNYNDFLQGFKVDKFMLRNYFQNAV